MILSRVFAKSGRIREGLGIGKSTDITAIYICFARNAKNQNQAFPIGFLHKRVGFCVEFCLRESADMNAMCNFSATNVTIQKRALPIGFMTWKRAVLRRFKRGVTHPKIAACNGDAWKLGVFFDFFHANFPIDTCAFGVFWTFCKIASYSRDASDFLFFFFLFLRKFPYRYGRFWGVVHNVQKMGYQ